MVEFEEPETTTSCTLDADGFKARLPGRSRSVSRRAIAANAFKAASTTCGLDTSMQFDQALTEYLVSRQGEGLIDGTSSTPGCWPVPDCGRAGLAAPDHAAEAERLGVSRRCASSGSATTRIVRRLRLRQLLLLLLRMAVIGLLALALARPTVDAPGMLGDAKVRWRRPLSSTLSRTWCIAQKTKPGWKRRGEMALWILPRLPEESQVGVLERPRATGRCSRSISPAKQRIGRLDGHTAPRPVLPIA